MMETGDGHKIYFEQCGNPQGIPVVVVHGGPGAGCSPAMRRYFNPKLFRIILFDQRGCGRSTPYAGVENNTTQHLIQDMESIRQRLDLDRWAVFGGSWGATLSLLYAQDHPDRATHLILRGVFLMTQVELDWFYGGGAGQFWPDLWQRFVSAIPEDEQHDLIAAYNKRLFSGNIPEETKFGQLWSDWENALASVRSDGRGMSAPSNYARTFARLENHYFINKGFLERDGQILANVDRIQHIPGFIVQGRQDMICPPQRAWDLAQAWGKCDLRLIPNAGHAMSEPRIATELMRITDLIAEMREG